MLAGSVDNQDFPNNAGTGGIQIRLSILTRDHGFFSQHHRKGLLTGISGGRLDVHIPAFFKDVNERGMARRIPESRVRTGKKRTHTVKRV